MASGEILTLTLSARLVEVTFPIQMGLPSATVVPICVPAVAGSVVLLHAIFARVTFTHLIGITLSG